MSGFFKTNIYIYIYIYICMLCFVAGAENEKICMECEGKEWYFTLYKTNEFGNKFYGLLKNKKSLTIQARLFKSPFNAEINLNSTDISLLEKITDENGFPEKVGDIILSSSGSSLFILGEEGFNDFTGMKVGELEESSIEDFSSFIKDKRNNGIFSLEFTFSIEESPQLGQKIIVTSLIWLLLLLPLLLLVYFIFK